MHDYYYLGKAELEVFNAFNYKPDPLIAEALGVGVNKQHSGGYQPPEPASTFALQMCYFALYFERYPKYKDYLQRWVIEKKHNQYHERAEREKFDRIHYLLSELDKEYDHE